MTLRSSPAALRNREPIADVLADILPARGRVLMIAEGSGEHAVHFAERFPQLSWLPTDTDKEALAAIAARQEAAALSNLEAPRELNAAAAGWPVETAAAIVCINMIHISPWSATSGLMRGVGRLLAPGSPLILYGPFISADRPTAQSNLEFDASLRKRDFRWGLRDLGDVRLLATANDLHLDRIVEMPANNLCVVFRHG